MAEELGPEEQAAREVALRRVEELEPMMKAAIAEFEAAEQSEDDVRKQEASANLFIAEQPLLRAQLEVARWGAAEEGDMTPAEVARTLLDRKHMIASLVPNALEVFVRFVVTPLDDPAMAADREQARNDLLSGGWLTEHELDTFPEAALIAIVRERFREREEGA